VELAGSAGACARLLFPSAAVQGRGRSRQRLVKERIIAPCAKCSLELCWADGIQIQLVVLALIIDSVAGRDS